MAKHPKSTSHKGRLSRARREVHENKPSTVPRSKKGAALEAQLEAIARSKAKRRGGKK